MQLGVLQLNDTIITIFQVSWFFYILFYFIFFFLNNFGMGFLHIVTKSIGEMKYTAKFIYLHSSPKKKRYFPWCVSFETECIYMYELRTFCFNKMRSSEFGQIKH